jgi:hypothetical protein
VRVGVELTSRRGTRSRASCGWWRLRFGTRLPPKVWKGRRGGGNITELRPFGTIDQTDSSRLGLALSGAIFLGVLRPARDCPGGRVDPTIPMLFRWKLRRNYSTTVTKSELLLDRFERTLAIFEEDYPPSEIRDPSRVGSFRETEKGQMANPPFKPRASSWSRPQSRSADAGFTPLSVVCSKPVAALPNPSTGTMLAGHVGQADRAAHRQPFECNA